MSTIKVNINDLDMLRQKCKQLVDEYKKTLSVNDLPSEITANAINALIMNELRKANIDVVTNNVSSQKSLYGEYYISSIELTTDTHRSNFIIHKPHMFYFAEFKTKEQLDQFADMLGFTYKQVSVHENYSNSETKNLYREYIMDHDISDNNLFWKRSDIPADAKPFKALSNGSIVTCYFTNDGQTITIYRPNPNSHDVYDPLEVKDHIRHVATYGLY